MFGEVSVPILKDVPASKELSLSVSGRYTDVASYGGQSTYKVGLNWEPTDFLRFRASQGTSFRSPALFELYLSRRQPSLANGQLTPAFSGGQR